MDFTDPALKNIRNAYRHFCKIPYIKFLQNLSIKLESSVEIHVRTKEKMVSLSVSVVSEPIDYH
jgi:hypothetical protein